MQPPAVPKVIVAGHAALDSVYRIERFPARPTKVQSLEHIEAGGGSAANAAATIARLGGEVEFWSRVGADDVGRRILAGLNAVGVDTANVLVHEGSRSSHAAVIVDGSGERFIVSERDHAMPAAADWLPIASVASASAVLSDMRWFEGTQALFNAARRHGIPTILDIDVGGGQSAARVLPLADYAIFSAPGIDAFAGPAHRTSQLEKVLEAGARYAGVTMGAEGYAWRKQDGTHGFQAAFRTAVVDSTGAGDAFHGAFAWAIANGETPAQCARVASAVAALKLGRLGARDGLPTAQRLAEFLAASP